MTYPTIYFPKILWVLMFTTCLVGGSCNLKKNIDLDLPAFESELMVECYLIPGEPYRLALSESVSYFSDPQLPTVDVAEVLITNRGETIILNSGFFADLDAQKFYNYGNDFEIVPAHYYEDFFLEITDSLGRHITAKTQLLPPIPIDTLELEFDDSDTLALVLTRLTDPETEENFYRRILRKGKTITDSVLDQDFITDDRFIGEDHKIVFGSGFDYLIGDTLISMVFHIDQPYFDFYESIESAISSNGDPFSTPGALKSNVTGGIGIFTGLSLDKKMIIVSH